MGFLSGLGGGSGLKMNEISTFKKTTWKQITTYKKDKVLTFGNNSQDHLQIATKAHPAMPDYCELYES